MQTTDLILAYTHLDSLTFWLLAAVLAAAIATVILNSVYILRSDEMIAFFLFGTWRKTTVTLTYYEENQERIRAVPDGHDKVSTGIFGYDVAFGLWPFVKGFRLPTATFEIPISASAMYTRVGQPGKEILPRIRLRGDGTLQIGLHPVVKKIVTVVPIIHQGITDLAEVVPLKDVPLGPNGESLKGPAIINLINGAIKKPMLQAMRTAASNFTWGSVSGEDDTDIINQRDKYEWAIQRVLLQPGSIFLRAGFLKEPGLEIRGNQGRWSNYQAEKGDSLVELDVVVELIRPEPTPADASELEKSIDLAFIGLQEGARDQARERMRRIGQAEGLAEMAKQLGISEEKIQLLLFEAIREGKLDVTMIGGSGAEGLVGFVNNLIKKEK